MGIIARRLRSALPAAALVVGVVCLYCAGADEGDVRRRQGREDVQNGGD